MKLFIQHLKGIYSYLLAGVVFLVFAYLLGIYYSSESYKELLFKRFQDNFIREQNELDLRVDDLIENISNNNSPEYVTKSISGLQSLSDNRYMYFFAYEKDSLISWSTNRIAEAEILPVLTANNQLLQLSNGWFYTEVRNTKTIKIIALLLIKNNYTIQNKNLVNEFNPAFSLQNDTKVRSNVKHAEYVIYTKNNKAVFSVVFGNNRDTKGFTFWIIVLIYSFSFSFFIMFFRKLSSINTNVNRKVLDIILYGFTLWLFVGIMEIFRIPDSIYFLPIFKLRLVIFEHYTISLGNILLSSIILFVIIFSIYQEITPKNLIENFTKIKRNIFGTLALIASIIYLLIINRLFEKIIFNSGINFDIKKLLENDFNSILGIFTITILLATFILVCDFIFNLFFKFNSLKRNILISGSVILVFFLFYWHYGNYLIVSIALLLVVIYLIIIYVRSKPDTNYKYVHIILFVVIISIYSIITIYLVDIRKSENDEKKLVFALLSERDPIAEYLTTDLNRIIRSDTILKNKLSRKDIDFPWIYKYIHKRYFSGYWDRYDLQLTICNQSDSLLLKPETIYTQCFSFFNSLISHEGVEIGSTGFYFLKTGNGHISYLSKINFDKLNPNIPVNLYLQLDSKLMADELGYPELLLDKKFENMNNKLGYSYAKYYNQKLIYEYGDYSYNLVFENSIAKNSNFKYQNFGGYTHLLYKSDKNNLLILSKPSIKPFDMMVSFSYLFIFYFISLNFLLYSINNQIYSFLILDDFKTKIRFSVIGVLLFSLFIVGCITVYFIINQFRNKQYEFVSEKLQSVYMELEGNLAGEDNLTYSWKSADYNNLEELLRRLSNIFSTDINLYDISGRMIASSRPEIFDKGIAGTLMNPMALSQLTLNNKFEFIQDEEIGKLKYISIYSTFTNDQGKLLAYLNLPYFTKQSTFTKEISSILIAIINFYVILTLISLFLAVFISERITKPLRLIQEKFARVKLGKRSEKIVYKDNDEIGKIVEEYNRLVDELDHSIDLLAKSERESAWREMAKQVAHEIKNPLTPMKLSIQQLQRAWNDKSQNLDDYFGRVTKTLIEQIENLSTIAAEFSNFAKMPKANIEKLDVNTLISSAIDLFIQSGVKFNFKQLNVDERFCVNADKEQLIRVFINLFTNAVQSIPEGRKGIVDIKVEQKNNTVEISIKDNGSGIPEDIVEKLFQPNFTTKSAGTGLGLAISKNIIENINGTLKFNTHVDKGTIFFINLPLV